MVVKLLLWCKQTLGILEITKTTLQKLNFHIMVMGIKMHSIAMKIMSQYKNEDVLLCTF